jgi:Tol biopolymer transport system component
MRRVVLTLLALVGITAWSQPTSDANDRTALVAYSAGDSGKVYVARADGNDARNVATGGGEPALSPDGRWVAYPQGKEYRPPTRLVIRAVTGRYVQRIPLPALSQLVGWAGDNLVLQGAKGGVFVRTPHARAWRTLAPAGSNLEFAAASPDGTQIALTDGDISIVPVAGGPARKLTTQGRANAAAWGPHGIAYGSGARGTDIWMIRADGSDAHQLTYTGQGILPIEFDAAGDRLLAANPAMHNGRLWAVDATAGTARPLTDWQGDLYGQGISRDGRTIYAAVGCGGIGSLYGAHLETIPFAGGTPRTFAAHACRGSWTG